jgi:hypothetical protein
LITAVPALGEARVPKAQSSSYPVSFSDLICLFLLAQPIILFSQHLTIESPGKFINISFHAGYNDFLVQRVDRASILGSM